MSVFDAFVHPTHAVDEDALFELSGTLDELVTGVCDRSAKAGIGRTHLTLFDPGPVMSASAPFSDHRCVLSALVHPGAEDRIAMLDQLVRVGARAITLHPYLQDLRTADGVAELAVAAADRGLVIFVCTAYGSRKIYDVDPMRIAVAAIEAVDAPVVLSHAGGARVLEAMLVADAFPNVYLETSFSLSYWLGSSVERDIAFSMRKLGMDRWMFGSDAPFVSVDKALIDHREFLARHDFGEDDGAMLFEGTASSLFGQAK